MTAIRIGTKIIDPLCNHQFLSVLSPVSKIRPCDFPFNCGVNPLPILINFFLQISKGTEFKKDKPDWIDGIYQPLRFNRVQDQLFDYESQLYTLDDETLYSAVTCSYAKRSGRKDLNVKLVDINELGIIARRQIRGGCGIAQA